MCKSKDPSLGIMKPAHSRIAKTMRRFGLCLVHMRSMRFIRCRTPRINTGARDSPEVNGCKARIKPNFEISAYCPGRERAVSPRDVTKKPSWCLVLHGFCFFYPCKHIVER